MGVVSYGTVDAVVERRHKRIAIIFLHISRRAPRLLDVLGVMMQCLDCGGSEDP